MAYESWSEYQLYICKEQDFSLLHHFRHRTKHRSRHFNHANYTNPFPVYFHFLQINANTSHTHLILCCITLLSIDIGQHMSKQCNLVSRLYVLRSLPNFHHREDLLLARRFEYKLGMVWIKGSEVIRCMSKCENFDPGFGRTTRPPRDPWPRVPLGSGCRLSTTDSLLLWTTYG